MNALFVLFFETIKRRSRQRPNPICPEIIFYKLFLIDTLTTPPSHLWHDI
jgi:hypothetical protein